MTVFPPDLVARHIRKKHPGCPEFAVEFLAKEVSGKKWTPGVKLGRAVGITMDGLLRHQMTEYETLLLHGVDREEARKRVQPRVEAMLGIWKTCVSS
ncbi:DUF2293 domain-containing protein [Neorhizobium sp. T786]|uniref:DUF2293 domain-containing protein n=1 Tax=Pseudorhizobium xiangyangii TaxID=2883104 RepID=UPI001CFFB0BC|nr:DUF2293 domain-containing protein [Neorhizobium xiangyangii]MCB5203172.1 DUF2293 domain-containing protein [Neorhizobium xiangyangii]